MTFKRLGLFAVLAIALFACKDEKPSGTEVGARIIGEDGRFDCADSTMSIEESRQWEWLRRGFRMPSKPHGFPKGDFRVTLLRREPTGMELFVQLERSMGRDQGLLVRPSSSLFQEYQAAVRESGLAVSDLWTPKTRLDSQVLPDSLVKIGFSLLEAKGLQAIQTMRRCDTANQMPSPLQEALYLVRVEAPDFQGVNALRPGFYADSLWNQLQRFVDQREAQPIGVGF
ncbi:MAG: hypothetical protein RL318_2132 [Fibrobacterota bacterium]|jgi:hypothetical protein